MLISTERIGSLCRILLSSDWSCRSSLRCCFLSCFNSSKSPPFFCDPDPVIFLDLWPPSKSLNGRFASPWPTYLLFDLRFPATELSGGLLIWVSSSSKRFWRSFTRSIVTVSPARAFFVSVFIYLHNNIRKFVKNQEFWLFLNKHTAYRCIP